MWGIAIITCAVISQVIYGLRVDVREAARFGQYVLEGRSAKAAWAWSTAPRTPCSAGQRRSSCCSKTA